jgi:PAS domain S-box-containing protein
MRLNLKLTHWGFVLVGVPVLVELVLLALLSVQLQQSFQERRAEIRSKSIIAHVGDLIELFHDMSTGPAGFGLTGGKQFSERYEESARQVPEKFEAIEGLLDDKPAELKQLNEGRLIADNMMKLLSDLADLMRKEDRAELLYRIETDGPELRLQYDQLAAKMESIIYQERKVELASPEAQSKSRERIVQLLIVGAIGNIILALALTNSFGKAIVKRLAIVQENCRRLVTLEAPAVILTGKDEIAELDRALHRVAEELSELRERERAILESTLDVVCSIDSTGRFLRVGPSCQKLWGYSSEELIGRRLTDFIAEDSKAEAHSLVANAVERSSRCTFETSIRKRDGQISIVYWYISWSKLDNSLFCVAQDITGRKQYEKALEASESYIRSIIDRLPVGVVICDRSGQIESLNTKSSQMLQWSQADLAGKSFTDILESSLFPTLADFLQTLNQKEIGGISEWRIKRKAGPPITIELTRELFETATGTKHLLVLQDISERENIERLKKEFVAMVSHELRTPLTSIRGTLGLATAGAFGHLNENAENAFRTAERNAVRLTSLVNDLLDLQKLESGKVDMELREIAVCSAVERALDSVKGFAEKFEVEIALDLDDLLVRADEDRLIQVLVNLLSNAAKFSPKGSTITLSVREVGDTVLFSITDQGRGIPAEYKDVIFERFQQVDRKQDRQKGGTGLGLAICRAIVEQHGGIIGFDSEEGKGSTFWFKLPLERPEAPLTAA